MPKINGSKTAKGGTVYISEEILKTANLAIDDEVGIIPGDQQLILKKRQNKK